MKEPGRLASTSSWKDFLRLSCDQATLETLTAYVRDNEHEMFAVITALQAHIELLEGELKANKQSVDRFPVLDRAVDRLISDATILSSVSEMAKSPRTKRKVLLEGLMEEVIAETLLNFRARQVAVSTSIDKGAKLAGHAAPLKLMFKAMLLAVLCTCEKLDTIKIVGMVRKRHLFVAFDTGMKSKESQFKTWPLGELRSIAVNGEGIGLAAIDAMARMHRGQLSVCHHQDKRDEYMLTFTY